MRSPADELARRLAREAQAVCRHYLSNGRRAGRYWLVGDVANTPGRSLFVRLKGPDSGKGAAGKWTDAATGEHGDLLDLIALNRGLDRLRDVLDEAQVLSSYAASRIQFGSIRSRAFRSDPIAGIRAAACSPCHSRSRALSRKRICAGAALRLCMTIPDFVFIHAATIDPDADAPTETWPAMIAAVTDLDGRITGVHRTWLDPSGRDKAPVDSPRRAMGHLLGQGVRFGVANDVMAAGEGIETMLSLRCVMPTMPMVAALSAAHLAAILFPVTLRRLYIARDADPAGDGAMASLIDRANEAGIEAISLSPRAR